VVNEQPSRRSNSPVVSNRDRGLIVGPKTPRGKGRKKQVVDADR
jgi:hypothetical protein